MIYLWVAVGGALGSVARFWLNNLVAAALGAEFPWGTLLINIIGSFVISFFGTLTTKVARFAVPPEISMFVIVGICGGFTTFSSFSLQTIQLARAGEWDRAFLYVLASVILCLLVCWLGVIAAFAISGAATPGMAKAAPGPTMFETETEPSTSPAAGAVLAYLPRPETVSVLLDSAQELAAIFGRPIAALHVQVDPETTIIPSAEILPQTQAEEISKAQAALKAEIARQVAIWVQSHPDAALTFLERFGGETSEFLRHAQNAAAIVLPLEKNQADGAVTAAVFETSCPVLAMPPGCRFKPSHVAIAWKDIGHARAAMAAATPLIAQAQRITVIGIGDPERLKIDRARMLLGPHSARVTVINLPGDGRKTGEQLLEQVKSAGAGTLILGAARHGRVAEWMLGGVTGTVMDSTDTPLFLKQ